MRERILDNSYRLLEEIGRGGFGAVYRAVRIGAEGSGPVAIKLLNRNPAMKTIDYVRFQREATLMSQLVHQGIVTVYELGEDVGSYFIVMEYISGPNLRDFVKSRGGRLSLPEILDILLQAAEALEYVHGHNIVHRDIKPQNILVCESRDRGEPRSIIKVVDFGVARLSYTTLGASTQPSGNEVVGTYAYMAPEATGLVDWSLDHRTDIYSLGIVAYELLSGKTPFYDLKNEELCQAHVKKTPPPIRNFRGHEVPEILEQLVGKCIAKKPEDRYQSMFALVCDLRRLQASLRTIGRLEDFELATKDFGLGKILSHAYVGQSEIVDGIIKVIGRDNKRTRLSWVVIRGGVGLGKSRCLNEVRSHLEQADTRFLYLRFSESEQRLPFQSLTLAINDYLSHFEKHNLGEYREFLDNIARKLGDGAPEIARLIPALRPLLHANQNNAANNFASPTTSVPSGDDAEPDEELDIRNSETLDRRYAAPSSRINQSFVELFGSLVGDDSHLVFLLDDIHLADTSTLALFQFMTEQVNGVVNYSFVLTMRDRFQRSNLILDSFIRRLSNLKRRYQSWELRPFEEKEVENFLQAMGMANPPEEFVRFILQKSNGSPLQLHALIKQMLAQNILVPMRSSIAPSEPISEFGIAWERLPEMVIEFVNIEVLIASLDTLEKRDLLLMRIAAVSYDACEYEYFRIDHDFAKLEVETRIIGLVRRGILDIIGDENAPLNRRAFVFAHEKLRNAILSNMDLESRRTIHLSLAKRIESIYRNPRRDQILSLAKHYDGAGDKANASTAARSFLKAVRIYVRSQEHNLAKYYLEKTLERVGEILNQQERLQRMREVLEAEYMIYAAQGNLVAASNVCKQLIEITFDPVRKDMLQVFWAQLLLGLGRHTIAFNQSRKIVRSVSRIDERDKGVRFFASMHYYLIGTFFYAYFNSFLLRFFKVNPKNLEIAQQATVLMALAQFHGCEEDVRQTLLVGARLNLLGRSTSRWNAVYALLFASLLMRMGHVGLAYKMCENVERFLERQGVVDASRWVRALKALWLDYPMGRFDRLHLLFESNKELSLPSSGLLHFETYGLKAWLRLIAPTSPPAQEAQKAEIRKRRRSDRNGSVSSAFSQSAPVSRVGADNLLESNSARRVLDSGENGQYTSLTLFSDALRFALVDKLDPLRRAVEQLRRQESGTVVGDAFASYAYSLQSLVTGRLKEALQHYLSGTRKVMRIQAELISLPVSDGLRLAVIIIPLMAVSSHARGWPWGPSLKRLMEAVDKVLLRAEGEKNPRRNAMAALFRGVRTYMGQNQTEAFEQIGLAINEARTQRTELLECVGRLYLACFCALEGQLRAKDEFVSAFRLASTYNWKLLERHIAGLARRTKVNIEKYIEAEKTDTSANTRDRQLGKTANHILTSMQKLSEANSQSELFGESLRLAMNILKPTHGFIFILEQNEGREKFVCRFKDKNDKYEGEMLRENDILKWLGRNADEPVRLVPLDMERSRNVVVPVPPGGKNALRLASASMRVALVEMMHSVKMENHKEAPVIQLRNINSDESTVRNDASTQKSTVATANKSAETDTVDDDSQTVAEPTLQNEKGVKNTQHNIKDNTKNNKILDDVDKHDDINSKKSSKNNPPRNRQETCYLVLVALTNGSSLLGWIALAGVPASVYASNDLEQDLMMLGLHSGYLLSKFQGRILDDVQMPKAQTHTLRASHPLVDGEIPRDVVLEHLGHAPMENAISSWKVYRLKPRRMILIQWRFASKATAQEERLVELVSRHLNFFVTSLRQKAETGRIELLLLRLFTDFSTIFETVAKEGTINAIDLGIVILDCNERVAVEGVFGDELFSFSGSSHVENEFLQEMHGILSGDRLVYRERVRRLTGAGGWLFAGSDQAKGLLAKFAQIDFIENYLQDRRYAGLTLAKALGVDDARSTPGFAVVCLDQSEAVGTKLGA